MKGRLGMDLSNYRSLRICSEEEVLRQMNGANKKVEIYAPDIDGDLFSKLPLPTDLNIKLVLSKQIFDGSDDKFLDLFERVFYKSFQMKVDINKEQRIKGLKVGCIFSISFLTILFLSLSQLVIKWCVFLLIIGFCVYFYFLLKHKTKWLVSEIKRWTNFKVMDDHLLAFLPAIYVIDEKLYIGTNLLKPSSSVEVYEVQSEEEKQQLIVMYECYANQNSHIPDEWIINYYLERMDLERFTQMRYQD